jgi:hypothetical protein
MLLLNTFQLVDVLSTNVKFEYPEVFYINLEYVLVHGGRGSSADL